MPHNSQNNSQSMFYNSINMSDNSRNMSIKSINTIFLLNQCLIFRLCWWEDQRGQLGWLAGHGTMDNTQDIRGCQCGRSLGCYHCKNIFEISKSCENPFMISITRKAMLPNNATMTESGHLSRVLNCSRPGQVVNVRFFPLIFFLSPGAGFPFWGSSEVLYMFYTVLFTATVG
jgi:hypothetical protein